MGFFDWLKGGEQFNQGGYEGLGIGNPASYGGQNLPVKQPWQKDAANIAGNLLDKSGTGEGINKWVILLDMLGSKIAPKNPFAGVGQYMGQSEMVNEAMQRMNEQQNALPDYLKSITTPGVQPSPSTTGLQKTEVKPAYLQENPYRNLFGKGL